MFKVKRWPKKILSWCEIYERALKGQPKWKLRYGDRERALPYRAVGGPYDGKLLALTDGTTAVIRVTRGKYGAEWRGRYLVSIVTRAGIGDGETVWKPC